MRSPGEAVLTAQHVTAADACRGGAPEQMAPSRGEVVCFDEPRGEVVCFDEPRGESRDAAPATTPPKLARPVRGGDEPASWRASWRAPWGRRRASARSLIGSARAESATTSPLPSGPDR